MNKLIWIIIIIALIIAGIFIFKGGDKNYEDKDDLQENEQADTSDIEALTGEELIDSEIISDNDDVDLGELV